MQRKGKFFQFRIRDRRPPDKVCDQISDAVLDAVLTQGPDGRVACETFVARGLVIVGGEITTKPCSTSTSSSAGRQGIGYTRPSTPSSPPPAPS